MKKVEVKEMFFFLLIGPNLFPSPHQQRLPAEADLQKSFRDVVSGISFFFILWTYTVEGAGQRME